MRILVTGGAGMLARTLVARWRDLAPVALARAALDVTDPDAIGAALAGIRPEVVVNCAALTAVDRCETERDAAQRINGDGAAALATACAGAGARLVQISTDYVFAGDAGRAYREDDPPAPRTVYGATKLAGERAVLAASPSHLVARVAWLYGAGGPSFVHTMLRLARADGAPVRVVADQHGAPTSAAFVADALRTLIATRCAGVVHVACGGDATWFDVAQAVFAHARSPRALVACTTAEFPRPAPRPADSRLDTTRLRASGVTPPPWRDALAAFLAEHPDG